MRPAFKRVGVRRQQAPGLRPGSLSRVLSAALAILLAASCRPEPLRFAFLTDCHYSEGSRSGADLGACIADINGLAGIDFVLFGGDLTDFGSDAEIHAVKAIIDSLRRGQGNNRFPAPAIPGRRRQP